MEKLHLSIMGISPLLIHSNQGVNPLHPIQIKIKKLTGKRNKTDEDLLQIMDLEYELALYYDEKLGPVIPAQNIEAVIRDGAKKIRRGKDAQSCIFIEPDFIKLQYDGPRDLPGLLANPNFRDIRPAKIKQASVLRCRPRFNKWSLECVLNFDSTILNREEIVQCIDIAGRQLGLCDYRPRYGRFYAEVS